jgi:hypothetical protein
LVLEEDRMSNGICEGQSDSEGVLAALPTDYTVDLSSLHRAKIPGIVTSLGFGVAIDQADYTIEAGQTIPPRCYPVTIVVSVTGGTVTLVRPKSDGDITVWRPDPKTGTTSIDAAANGAREVVLRADDSVQLTNATHGFENRSNQDATIHALSVRPDQSPCGPCYTYPP